MTAHAQDHAIAALWVCILLGFAGYSCASVLQRCAAETVPIERRLWVTMFLFCVACGAALLWASIAAHATVLVGAQLTRKAVIRQDIDAYARMREYGAAEVLANLWAFLRKPPPPPRLQLELMDRAVPGEYGGTDAAHQA